MGSSPIPGTIIFNHLQPEIPNLKIACDVVCDVTAVTIDFQFQTNPIRGGRPFTAHPYFFYREISQYFNRLAVYLPGIFPIFLKAPLYIRVQEGMCTLSGVAGLLNKSLANKGAGKSRVPTDLASVGWKHGVPVNV